MGPATPTGLLTAMLLHGLLLPAQAVALDVCSAPLNFTSDVCQQAAPLLATLNFADNARCCAVCAGRADCSVWNTNAAQGECHLRGAWVPNKGPWYVGRGASVPHEDRTTVAWVPAPLPSDSRGRRNCHRLTPPTVRGTTHAHGMLCRHTTQLIGTCAA